MSSCLDLILHAQKLPSSNADRYQEGSLSCAMGLFVFCSGAASALSLSPGCLGVEGRTRIAAGGFVCFAGFGQWKLASVSAE